MDYIKFLILFTQVYGKRNFLLPSNYFLKYPEFRIHKLLIEEFFSMFFLAFPSWEEGANDVLCAKFIYFYEPKCFRNHTNIIMQEILNLQGVKRLQGTFKTKIFLYFCCFSYSYLLSHAETCYHLALALGDCLKFFNDRCSQDLLQTGEASFTSTVLGKICMQV